MKRSQKVLTNLFVVVIVGAVTGATTIPIAPAVASISTGQCEEVLGQEVHISIPRILQYGKPDYPNPFEGDYYLTVSIGNSSQVMKSPTVIEGNNSNPGWLFIAFVPYDGPTWLPNGYGGLTVLAINFSLMEQDASSQYDELIIEHIEQFDTNFQNETHRFFNDFVLMEIAIQSFETAGCASDIPRIVYNSTA